MSEEPLFDAPENSERFYGTRILAENTTLEVLQRPGPGVRPRADEFDELFGPLDTGWIFVPGIGEEGQKVQPIGNAYTTQEGERYAREGALPEAEPAPEPKGWAARYKADRARRNLSNN